ncbi:hypothetical protein G7Y89_g7044 [Cudoniella acicularis]|uniref:Uncharacterized protein n=1 Tax=Cudoniella acicularis TaxID=354080 RepID=A0A8H4RL59_9HELO|nr:hypothetical protein G7Y89_g7044 [Cudoniella acicularis]
MVQYWVDQIAILVNGTITATLQSPPLVWIQAVVTGSIYLAAISSETQPLNFQQLAASHAAHNSPARAFHGTRNFNPTDAVLKAILGPIGMAENSTAYASAQQIGKTAAAAVAITRADDNFNDFVDYTFGPNIPAIYQVTPRGASVPDTPQA